MINSIRWHNEIKSEDTASDLARKGNACTHMRSDVTDNMLMLGYIEHVQIVVVSLDTVGLSLAPVVYLYMLVRAKRCGMSISKSKPSC